MDNHRSTWAEIDLRAIRSNLHQVQNLLDPATKIMAVVKANAYGHGLLPVAKTCLEAGASYLGVATLDEALELRDHGIEAPILILGQIPYQCAALAIEREIELTVPDGETAVAVAKAAQKVGKPARIHIKLDTGMGRIGFTADDSSVHDILHIAGLQGLDIKGIFSHLATADSKDKSYAKQQIDAFKRYTDRLKQEGLSIPIRHLANSAAIMDLPEAQFEMVRSGIITYGLYPSDEVQKERLSLVPAMRLISRISFLKSIPAGSSVSYGRTFISSKEIRVATVPIGYADGYSRLLSNRAYAVVNHIRVPLIGRVCMDQCMFDVSEVPDVKVGDEIILFGRPEDGVTADHLAAWMDTINYEIVCMPGSRIPRFYRS